MSHVLMLLLGIAVSAICVYLAFEAKRQAVKSRARELESRAVQLEDEKHRVERLRQERETLLATTRQELDQLIEQKTEEHNALVERARSELKKLEQKVVKYDELRDENQSLKHDLQNIDVNLRKLQLDRDLQQERQDSIEGFVNELGRRFLNDNVKWISSSITANNYVNCKKKLQNVIDWCKKIGHDVSPEEEARLFEDLKREFEHAVRVAYEKEEQARIKAQIREEQKLEREIEREIKQSEREREAVQAALEKALAEAKDEHSAEVERLRARLAEAEQKAERAMSRAQMTKSGHVYVISNLGSFGQDVYKVGMTRRLEPQDRVRELGDASVPFPFDVHMMISSDDAPALENALHKKLHFNRINKVNPRKEFFRVDLDTIRTVVEENHGQVEYVADMEALEYRESLEVSDDDVEVIEEVYEEVERSQGDGRA